MSDICNHDLLEASIDGHITPEAQAQLDAHLLECRTCASEAVWLKRERALFRERVNAPVDALWAGVQARLAPPPPQRSRAANWTGGLVAAAAAILVLVKVVAPAHVPSVNVNGMKVTPMPGAALPQVADTAGSGRWVFDDSDRKRIEVGVSSGDVHVTTSPGKQIRIETSSDDLGNCKFEVREDGSTITVGVACPMTSTKGGKLFAPVFDSAPSVDVTIELPTHSHAAVNVSTASGDVSVDNVQGDVSVTSKSGDVSVDNANVSNLETVSGDISIEHGQSSPLRIESVSGDVSWQGTCAARCDMKVQTESGDVQLEWTKDSGFVLDATKQGPPHRITMTTGNKKGRIKVTSVSGDVSWPRSDEKDDEAEEADEVRSAADQLRKEADELRAEADALRSGAHDPVESKRAADAIRKKAEGMRAAVQALKAKAKHRGEDKDLMNPFD